MGNSWTRTSRVFVYTPFIGAIFVVAMATQCLAQDQFPHRPANNVNNVWYSHDEDGLVQDKDTVVVFVHGILSNSRDAWFYEGQKDTVIDDAYWPDIVAKDEFLKRPSVFLGGFVTRANSGKYDIRQAAIDLYGALTLPAGTRKGHVIDKKKIIFIAHSTGGLVVKHMLVRERDAFKDKKVGVVLVASPSRGSTKADRLSLIAGYLKNKMGQQLQFDHPFLEELHHDFQKLVSEKKIPSLDGIELMENHFIVSWLSWLISPVVPKESVEPYFNELEYVGDTDHFSIAKPNGVSHPSHQKLRKFVVQRFARLMQPECSLPSQFHVRLVVEGDDKIRPRIADVAPPYPNISVERHITQYDYKIKMESRQKTQNLRSTQAYYELSILGPNPCPGDAYRSMFYRAGSSDRPEERGRLEADKKTEFCFVRSRSRPIGAFAGLECREGASCVPFKDQINSGLAEPCKSTGFLDKFRMFHGQLIGLANAAEGGARADRVWVVPPRDSLLAKDPNHRPAFTEFYLRGSAGERMRKIRFYTFGVRVNGQEIYFGGVPPHSARNAYYFDAGIDVNFALENLNFSGGRNGYESIAVDFRFYDEKAIIVTESTITFPYISYRHLMARIYPFGDNIADVSGFTVKAHYRPGTKLDTHEIFLASSNNVRDLIRHRARVESLKLTYEGMPLIGVLRPPLPPNPHFGLTLGFLRPNNQVEASFSSEKAMGLCKWLWAERAKLIQGRGKEEAQALIRDDVYQYEFVRDNFLPSEILSDSNEKRGKWAPCSKVIEKR